MIWWQVVLAALLGAGIGYGGGLLAPRWMERPPHPWAVYALVGVNGVLTALLAAKAGMGPYFWHQVLFIAILTTASLVDLYDRIIPNELVLFGLATGLLLLFVAPYPGKLWWQGLAGGGAGFGFLLLLAILVKGGMGMGDVKLAAVIGLFLGLNLVGMGLVLGFLAGGLVSLPLLLLRAVGRKDHIPFGPFLALGAIATVVWGLDIWNWYLDLYL